MALFKTYIGAQFRGVDFSDVPVNSNCEFHFILSFAIDYTSPPAGSPQAADGNFGVYWDKDRLSPEKVLAIKAQHPNVKVALSLGGDSVRGENNYVYFNPSASWHENAVSSLTNIIRKYHLDGIDINYEHFHSHSDPAVFSSNIGRLISTLKLNGTISFASIAPFNDDAVQAHYQRLWKDYASVVDHVNFQFYANPKDITVDQFMEDFERQNSKNYPGGRILVSYLSDGKTGLPPGPKFEDACKRLKRQNKLHGIFVWSADTSKSAKFRYEIEYQQLLTSESSSPLPAPPSSAASSRNNIILDHDFAQRSTHWSFNTCNGAIVGLGGGTYAHARNRTSDWQGLEQVITPRFRFGTFYRLSALVRASSLREPIMATLRLEYQGSEDQYEEIGRIQSTSSIHEWEELAGNISLDLDGPQPKKVVFYIEGPRAGVDLLVKSVYLTS